MLARSCGWLLFCFPNLIWVLSSWPLHWLECGGENGYITHGKRIVIGSTAFPLKLFPSHSSCTLIITEHFLKVLKYCPILDQMGRNQQSPSLQNLDLVGVIAKLPHRGEFWLGTSKVWSAPSMSHSLKFIKRPSGQQTEPLSSDPGSLQPGPSGSSQTPVLCRPDSTCQTPEGRVNQGL